MESNVLLLNVFYRDGAESHQVSASDNSLKEAHAASDFLFSHFLHP